LAVESLLLGLTAAAIFGFADLIAVVVARRIPLVRLLLWVHVGAFIIGVPYLLLAADLGALSPGHWALFGVLSLVFLGMQSTFYKGLQIGPVVLVSPIVSAHLVIVILLSTIFLGERLESVQMLGISIAMFGLLMATMTLQSDPSRGSNAGKGVTYALISMVGVGVFIFAVGALSKEIGWFLPIFLVRAGSFFILLPAQRFAKAGSWWSPSPKLVMIAILVGALQFSGLAAYASGAQMGSVSLVAAMFSIYPIIPMIGGVILMRERIVPRQAAGLASVCAGLLVLGMTS
jgi:drug/metabolite transporter (DMT)-like permease